MTTILPIKEIRKKVPKIVDKTEDITSKKKDGKFDIFKKNPKDIDNLRIYRLLEKLEDLSKQIVHQSKKIEMYIKQIEKKKNLSQCADREKKKLYLAQESISSFIESYDRMYKEMEPTINNPERIDEKFLQDIKSKRKPKRKRNSESKWKSLIDEYKDMEKTIYNLDPVDEKSLQDIKSKPKSKSKSKSSSSDEEEGFIPPAMYNLSSVRGIAKWIRKL